MELQFHNNIIDFSELKNMEITVVVDDDGLYNISRMRQRRIIKSGETDGRKWFIVSYGSHPCAYVESDIPERLIDEIRVHGDITFAGKAFPEFKTDGRFIGWDYNHCEDYNAEYQHGGKRWTVEEILDDVKSVITQLNENGW